MKEPKGAAGGIPLRPNAPGPFYRRPHALDRGRQRPECAGKEERTDANGRLTLQVAPGAIEITVVKEGFNPATVTATVIAGQLQAIPIPLERETTLEEHVTVSATRADKRIEDQPMRVEVLDAEEIEEKQLMTRATSS